MTKDDVLILALEALENLYDTCDWHGDDGKEAMVNAPKAIAAIKEALAQPAQKPFGYLSISDTPIFQKEMPEIGQWETLYTTPQPRPWVGLTFAEICEWENDSLLKFARAIEQALKEKNT